MQTSIKVCVSHTFLFAWPSMHKTDDADIMHTYCRPVKTLCRHDADYHIGVHDVYAQGNFLTVFWILQDLRGVKGMDLCWLLPGVLMGREAGRPRVVWPIRSSAISGGGLRRLT